MAKKSGLEFPVGYKQPPLHTRFRPGQSGNPSGRPKKKTKTLAELLKKELNTRITVNEGGKQRQITKYQAIVKQQTNKAVTGDLKAAVFVTGAVEPREVDQTDNLSPVLQAMRAIHANHELANHNAIRTSDAPDLTGNMENNGVANDPD